MANSQDERGGTVMFGRRNDDMFHVFQVEFSEDRDSEDVAHDIVRRLRELKVPANIGEMGDASQERRPETMFVLIRDRPNTFPVRKTDAAIKAIGGVTSVTHWPIVGFHFSS
jgi:hypothetical protein